MLSHETFGRFSIVHRLGRSSAFTLKNESDPMPMDQFRRHAQGLLVEALLQRRAFEQDYALTVAERRRLAEVKAPQRRDRKVPHGTLAVDDYGHLGRSLRQNRRQQQNGD